MEGAGFVHLHVHTHYSLLDGACRIPDLVGRAKALGMPSLAITDHGCMFGVIEFFNECKKQGVKPILGMEAYMAPGDRRERSTASGTGSDAAYHLLLLATNLDGYRNLVKLSSIAYREGFYYKPRIDKETLRQYKDGLIATSACLGGEVPSALIRRDAKTARKIAETYLEIFTPERFYIEVQKQGIKEQDAVNPELVEIARKLGCGTVATNDVHFLNKDDHFAHDVLCCISMGRLVTDENRLKYPTALYLKSAAEMREALGEFPEAIDNTLRIADQCNLELDFSKRYAPVYRVPAEKLASDEATKRRSDEGEQKDDERYLRQLCEEGLDWRYGTRDVAPEIRARLDKELKVIAAKHFCSYFLIVWDFCNYARSKGIPVGARGSGVGTMVGYLLGLCNVDPVRYGLLFERFMDPSRNEMPDIDIDICQDGRQEIIEYVRNKYGHVAQIITFGTLAARAVCKDVGRVLGAPLSETDKITKLIPGTPGMTLDKALKQSPDLAALYDANPQTKQIIDIGKRLEGLARNAGCHAAGVIIADQALDTLVPLYKDSDDNILTQFEGPVAEKVGLLKMDFLGLRTLSTLKRSIELESQTRERRGKQSHALPNPKPTVPLDEHGHIDIDRIDLADKNVLGLFARGETKGIFQFESGGMQDVLMKMQPSRVEDLIAANALYRPGPMELIPLYCNRRHGREPVPSVHPIMDGILKDTYGVMVFQEQVMQIFNQLGGIELSNAYKLIKAISKKTVDVIAKFKTDFIKGTTDKGVSKDKAEEIFELILKFGGYGFNRAHSTGYAILAYKTAYMKVYHPVEYMAALLTYEMGTTEKVVEYIEECRRLNLPNGRRGVRVLPPDVNISDVDFTPVYEEAAEGDGATKRRSDGGKRKLKTEKTLEGTIRFGLAAVKGVGTKAVENVIAERAKGGRFSSLYDFCERIDLRMVTRSTTEALIKCGAFTTVADNRAQLLAALDRACQMGHQAQQDRRMGQMSMFGGGDNAASAAAALPAPALPNVPEFSRADLLKNEKDVLGFYITSHPLADIQSKLENLASDTTRTAATRSDKSDVTIGGMIVRVKNSITKSGRSAGQKMAFLTLEDLEGQIDAALFADNYAEVAEKHPDIVAAEQIVFLKGRIDRRRETPCVVINEMLTVDEAVSRLTSAVVLHLDTQRHPPGALADLKPLLKSHTGTTNVFIQVPYNGAGQAAILKLGDDLRIRPTPAAVQDLERLLGTAAVQLCGPGTKRARAQQQKLFKDAEAPAEPAAPEPTPTMESGEPELDEA